MAYTINYSNGTKPAITVSNNSVNTTTNIGLIGQGYTNYGELQAENLLRLLENFSNGTSPSKPIEGQLWYDSENNSLKYFDDTIANSGNWKPVASMTVQSTPPTSVGETDGHFWLDNDSGTVSMYYNGSWQTISDVSGDTQLRVATRYDLGNGAHKTVEILVNGQIVSITSADNADWEPQAAGAFTEYLDDGVTLLNTQFPLIKQGINLNTSGDYVFNGTATASLYSDLAERYHADAVYAPGTVVKIGGEKEITASDKEFCADVFGVVSTAPGLMMNSGAGTNDTHPYIALAGRIPVQVVGQVAKGDRLVTSSTVGHAMSAGTRGVDWQYVIGRALESKDTDAPGLVEVVVGVK